MEENKQQLTKNFEDAQCNFLHYTMKITHGPIEDIVYNTEQAIAWDKTVKELRNKIIHYETKN